MRRGIRDERVLDAMRAVPRELFVPEDARRNAYDDAALALDRGQTISQPFVVALICQSLGLAGDERVLDVGTGSGYQAAVLAELAGEVVSVEVIPELSLLARGNLAAAGYGDRVELAVGNVRELDPGASFDAIAVAAASDDLPPGVLRQLAPEGRIVLPVGGGLDQMLVLVERRAGRTRTRAIAPVRFVPLVP